MITVIDSQNGKVKNSPDIISRGFIYLKEIPRPAQANQILNQKSGGRSHRQNASHQCGLCQRKPERACRQIFIQKNSPPTDGLAGYYRGVEMA